jgi:anaerobic selenocysteine-containing dehydrogenase
MKTDFVALTKKVMKEVNTDMEWEQIIEYALRVGFEAGKKFEDNVQRPIWRKKIENEIENAECETAEKIFAELEKEAEMQDYDGEDIAFIYLSKWTKFKSRFVGKKESEL